MTGPATPELSPFRQLFYSSDEDRLRAGWRLLLQLLMFVFFTILFSIPFAGVIIQSGQQSTTFFIVNGLLTTLAATVSIYLAIRWLDHRSFIDLGLLWNRRATRDLILGIGLTGVIFAVIYFLEWALGYLQFESYAWQAQPLAPVIQATLLMLLAYVFTGWGEELVFRGYWLQNLVEGLNLFWGVVISSLFFSVVHLLSNPSVSLGAGLGLMVGGIFFAFAYLRTNQLWLPIGIHIGWNFFEGTVFGFRVSGTDPFALIRHTVAGPESITGGAFGPEAGLIILPALLIGTIVIYTYTRNRQDPSGYDAEHRSQVSGTE